MLIPKKIENALNAHLELEMGAIYNYLAVASWCESNGYEGSAAFYYKQSAEEQLHFMKFFNYINQVGGHAHVPELKQPQTSYKSILETCQKSLAGENKVTQSIYKLVELSRKENDHATEAFLKFFVDEQLEEEMQFTRLIDRIKLIGGGPQSLYYVDKELERLAGTKTEGTEGA
ncbi:MAG: ferritin [Bacteroidia bacterium]|jgi:ferritin|nr:ferritin [Bacteroidia bacterium]